MTTEQTKPLPISKDLREAVMRVMQRLAYYHPPLTNGAYAAHLERKPQCWVCRDAAALLNLLDAEQREYGPPIDVTDPSWLRDHPAEVTN